MLVVVIALAAGAVALAVSLRPSAAPSTLVSSSSPDYKATQSYYRDFGEEPIDVLVRGNLQKLVLSSDLAAPAGSRGLPVGQRPGRGARHGRRRLRAVRTARARPTR